MRIASQYFLAPAVVAAVLLAACAPPDDAPTPRDGGSEAKVDGPPTYDKDVQPIFMAKCSPCHAGQHLGQHDIVTSYADVSKPIESFDSYGCWNDTEQTMPKKVGECALILIMNGRMPSGAGCSTATPLEPDRCLSSDQKAVIAAWIAAGLPR